MKTKLTGKYHLFIGCFLLAAFVLWTFFIQLIDVQPVGVGGTFIGFATLNLWFHRLTGVHLLLYTITDWLGLVPLAVCFLFGCIGFLQFIYRKWIWKVDPDLILLGVYYLVVIFCYLIFEMVPINYRPILIEGRMEASYPSSTTLLVLSVMPTLALQAGRRLKSIRLKKGVYITVTFFSAFVVTSRLLSGVHWLTDICGAVLLSTGLFCIYKALVLLYGK